MEMMGMSCVAHGPPTDAAGFQRSALVDLLDPGRNRLYDIDALSAKEALAALAPERVNRIDGEFALVTLRNDESGTPSVVAARTLGVPARFACQTFPKGGVRVIFAHTIREIRDYWIQDLPPEVRPEDLKPFDPEYTQMLPAFYIVRFPLTAVRDREYLWFLDMPEHRRPPWPSVSPRTRAPSARLSWEQRGKK